MATCQVFESYKCLTWWKESWITLILRLRIGRSLEIDMLACDSQSRGLVCEDVQSWMKTASVPCQQSLGMNISATAHYSYWTWHSFPATMNLSYIWISYLLFENYLSLALKDSDCGRQHNVSICYHLIAVKSLPVFWVLISCNANSAHIQSILTTKFLCNERMCTVRSGIVRF